MESKKPEAVDYIVHEGIVVRMERQIKRMWILCLVMFMAFVLSNIGWIYYESQFEEVVTTQEVAQDVDTGSGSAYVTGIGDINGESTADSEKDNENPET